jgi:hypothetical protein
LHGPPEGRGGLVRTWLPLIAICTGTFMVLVDVTIVNVALPDMATDLHTSFDRLQWVVDIYALALAALVLGAGSPADLYGRRRLYLIGPVLFALASLASGPAPNAESLIAARGLQGIGGAVMFATTIALINTCYDGRERSGMAAGAVNTARQLGFAVGVAGLATVLTTGTAAALRDAGPSAPSGLASACQPGRRRGSCPRPIPGLGHSWPTSWRPATQRGCRTCSSPAVWPGSSGGCSCCGWSGPPRRAAATRPGTRRRPRPSPWRADRTGGFHRVESGVACGPRHGERARQSVRTRPRGGGRRR